MYHKRPITDEDIDRLRINLSIQKRKLSSEPVCDFCGEANPLWIYASRRMSTKEPTLNWRWAACLTCSELADSEDWAHLEERVTNVLKKLLGTSEVTPVLLSAVRLSLLEFKHYAIRILE